MDDQNLLLLASKFRKLRDKVETLSVKQEEIQTIKGDQGPKGEQGDRGFDGAPGKDGDDGADGTNGQDGKDGVSVVNAEISFDGSLVIYLSDGREIDCGYVVKETGDTVIQTLKQGAAVSGGGGITSITSTDGSVVITTVGGVVDLAINVFNSTTKGLVPASGGGITNFLRADGTFAAPPAVTPASPTTSVQFNNAGAFGGASTFTYNSGTDTLSVGKLVSANFTSAAQGLVPASGGGTTNFLRADGSFAAPPTGAPASPTNSIQFNNAGAFGGSANFTYSTGTNTFTVGPAGSNVNSTITTVAPTGSTAAGILRLLGTNASATNGIGGGITLTTGNGTGTQRGGNFILTSGAGGSTGNGGNITITSGTGRQGGNFSMVAGFGSNTTGGSFSMAGGQGSTIGGDLILEGGDGASSGGDITIRSGSTFGGSSGSINISAGQGGAAGNGTLTLQQGAMLAKYSGGGDDPVIHEIGFFDATPVVKPTITGSRASGAALQDLLTQLASLGLITDSTTA